MTGGRPAVRVNGRPPSRGATRSPASAGDDVQVDRRVELVVHLHGHLVGAQGLDRVAEDDLALVDRVLLAGGRVDRPGDVADGDRTEQAAARTGADRQVDGRTLELGLDLLGVVEVADLAARARGPDGLDGALAALGPADPETAGDQEVAAVAVLHLDDVAGAAETGDLLSQDELHVQPPQRAVDV